MGTILEDIYDVLFQPRAALARIANQAKLSSALVVFLVCVFVPMWAICLGMQVAGSPTSVGFIMVVQAIGSVAVWLIGTAVWHLCAELFGGRGSAVGLLTALGFAHFPRIFIVPLWVLATWLPAAISPLFLGGAGVVIAFWTISLEVLAISGAYEISRTKAVLVLLTPVLFMAIAAVILVFMAGVTLIQWPLGLAN